MEFVINSEREGENKKKRFLLSIWGFYFLNTLNQANQLLN